MMTPADLATVMVAAPDPTAFRAALDVLDGGRLAEVIAAARRIGAHAGVIGLIEAAQAQAG